MSFPPPLAFLLLPVMFLFFGIGRRLHRHRLPRERSTTVEAAIFGLFGLLLAFTFSGAVSRYDAHRLLLTEEANDIGTAYLRLDLLPVPSQPALRQLFREYTGSRLNLFSAVRGEVSPISVRLQGEIWQRSLAAVSAGGASPAAATLLLPAINTMIGVTATRQNAFAMHPPAIVFLLLFAFSCGCAFLEGYGVRANSADLVYPLMLAVVVMLTVYATLEVEYPSRGLIRLADRDQVLLQLRDSMK